MFEETKPPYIKPIINRPPRIREIYWCNFWQDAQLPEMWKRRPVVIISPKNSLENGVTILPLTTKKQRDNAYTHKLNNLLIDRQG
jgi:mRNA interferase MazF